MLHYNDYGQEPLFLDELIDPVRDGQPGEVGN